MDDLIDNAPLRYEKPTWHNQPHIGKSAALHAMFIESCMHILIQKHFSKHPQYKNILEIFLNALFYMNYSQFLDTIPFKAENLTKDVLEANYLGKAEYTSFYISVTLAMYLADIRNPKLYEQIKNILLKLGTWYQLQVRKLIIIFYWYYLRDIVAPKFFDG